MALAMRDGFGGLLLIVASGVVTLAIVRGGAKGHGDHCAGAGGDEEAEGVSDAVRHWWVGSEVEAAKFLFGPEGQADQIFLVGQCVLE